MAQRQKGSSAAGVTIVVVIIFVLASIGYYQYVYAPTIPTSTSTTTTLPSNIKTVVINITQNAASACGGASAVKTSNPVTCDAYAPNPAKLVIGVNNSVIFDNVDTAVHTATANDKSFDTGILNAGQQSSPILIEKAGTYAYYCAVHPWMKGELMVVQGTGTPSQTGPAAGNASSTSTTVASSSASSGSVSTTTTGSVSGNAGVTVSIPNGSVANTSSTGFAPNRIVVVIGVNNTVTWTNDDAAPHTVTATDKSFDSGNLNPGQTFAFTFSAPGTYDYFCSYHSWMKGTVVVKG